MTTGHAPESADSNPSPKRTSNRPRFQISLSTMLLITVVFSVMSAGLFHASRIPIINDELASLFGRAGTSQGSSRFLQIVFIMFTYSMPLLMAGLLATLASLWNWWNRRR